MIEYPHVCVCVLYSGFILRGKRSGSEWRPIDPCVGVIFYAMSNKVIMNVTGH